MNFIAIIKLVIQLLPMIEQLVAQAEALFPQSGTGAQKLDVVKTAIGSAYTVASGAEGAFEEVWPTINGVVNSIVAAKKAIAGGSAAATAAAGA